MAARFGILRTLLKWVQRYGQGDKGAPQDNSRPAGQTRHRLGHARVDPIVEMPTEHP
ncbi:MAG: hypothetical protein OEQ18_08160 [Gammaproteobacteria bacterium]|nr:hypothetical protein [Gammaproteobacteria bacterium]